MSEEEEKKQEASPAEDKARNAGWVGEEEWKGNGGDWVDFKEFNLRGELMGRINEQSSIISHLTNKVTDRDKALDDMSELQSKIAERAYKEAMKDLKVQKVKALEDDDMAGVVDLDEQISELKDNKPKPVEETPEQSTEDSVPTEITEWLGKPENRWYHDDLTMRSMADGISSGILGNNPEIAPSELLRQVEATMRKELPHRFNKGDGSDVDDGGEFTNSNRQKGKSSVKFGDLSEEQQAVARRFEKIGLMTKKEYIESLADAGEL